MFLLGLALLFALGAVGLTVVAVVRPRPKIEPPAKPAPAVWPPPERAPSPYQFRRAGPAGQPSATLAYDPEANGHVQEPDPDAALITLVGTGDFDFDIVGEAAYQEALEAICGGRTERGVEHDCTALLSFEPTNRYDRNAVRVSIGHRTVGYLPRQLAAEYGVRMRGLGFPGACGRCEAVIRGGRLRQRDGRPEAGDFGVALNLDWPIEIDLGA